MTTNTQDKSGNRGNRRVALVTGVSGEFGMALGAAIGISADAVGPGIGLGAGVGTAVGLILAQAQRASSGK